VIVPFFIPHQGCGLRCAFCDQNGISGERDGVPAAPEILHRIAAYRVTSGTDPAEVAFFGGSFTALPMAVQEQLLRPLQPLRASGTVAGIRVSTRPDALDGATVAFLREHGVTTVELGIQSMNDEVLGRSGRGYGARDVEHAFRLLRRGGMNIGAQLMPGLPGETPELSLASFDRTLELRPDFFRIYPTLVLAGTRLAAWYREGSYMPLTLQGATGLCKIMLHRTMKAGVPVIRIGLQPTAELAAEGTILAGPFHPAFRQLVEGELCRDLLITLVSGLPDKTVATVGCAPGRESDVAGQGRANLNFLCGSHGVRVTGITADPLLSREELELRGQHFVRKGNMVNDLNYDKEGDAGE
jgi:histone acetyltransferase (RNA polymerase elongator complex component)